MNKKTFCWTVIIFLMTWNGIAWTQLSCNDEILIQAVNIDYGVNFWLDGQKTSEEEEKSIWKYANSTPLEWFIRSDINEDAWNWINNWGNVTSERSNNWVVWEAVWDADSIYFFIKMTDDVRDDDQADPLLNNLHNDDSFHLWFESGESVSWQWPDEAKPDSNFLIHNSTVYDTYYRFNDNDGSFQEINSSNLHFYSDYENPEQIVWNTELSILKPTINNDTVYFNITYNDADDELDNGKIKRSHRLTWNGVTNEAPWNTLRKLILIEGYDSKVVEVNQAPEGGFLYLDKNMPQTEANQSYQDDLFQKICPIILTSSRDSLGFKQDTTTWSDWTKFSDAAIVWRAYWDPDHPDGNKYLYLKFDVFDDNLNSGIGNLIDDDGIQLWIDFNKSGSFESKSVDINILIHNTGNRYGFVPTYPDSEKFIIPYPDTSVTLPIFLPPPLGGSNWKAVVRVKIPDYFINKFLAMGDSILPVEIGYNDGDDAQLRETQLVWNNVERGIVPYKNFSNLGKFILSNRIIDNIPPSVPGIPIDAGKYTNDTLVVVNWTSAEDVNGSIKDYRLQVGTAPDRNDIFDRWIGNILNNKIMGTHGQTLYARVKARDRAGNIGTWSASSDGITIDITNPTAPGKPTIEFTIPDSVTFTWAAADDPESGIIDYQLQVVTVTRDTSIWIKSNDTKFTMECPDDRILYAMVQAKNGAGSIGEWSDYDIILKADIVFAFELSQNMAGQIEAMKQALMTAMNEITTAGIDAYFGVASFVDYPGSYNSCNYSAQYGVADDFPWKIDQQLTDDTSQVRSAIENLQIYSGGDGPQVYTRALLEGLFLDWRAESSKLIVMIGNAPAHDCDFFSASYGKDPGQDAQLDSWDDLDYEKVVDWTNRAGISIVLLDNGTATDSTLDYAGDVWKNFEYLAAETGGRHVIKDSLHQASATIEQLAAQDPKPDSLYPWIAEAEEMMNRSPYYGMPCDGGWRLTHSDQPIYSGVVFLKDSLYQFTVRAKAEIGNKAAPWLLVQVGNGFNGTCEIKSTEWQDYTFIAAIPKGYHCLSLTFLNDWWNPYIGGDRNLLIDNVSIQYDAVKTDTIGYVFEAEEMSHHSEGSTQFGKYWKLNKRYAHIEHDYYFEKPELKCEIFARADSAEGDWPAMDICLDENIITSFPINDTANTGYQFTLTELKQGKHSIKIAYNNAQYHRGRNLYIDKLIIYVNDRGLLKSLNDKSVEEQSKVALPDKYALDQNYPNPFNPDTYINYQLPEEIHVSIKIFNTMGQEIRTLVNEERGAGYYTAHWDGFDDQGNRVVSGIYLYQIRADHFVCTRKLVLLK